MLTRCWMLQAREASKSADLGRCYFDWNDWLNNHPSTPYTPSIPLLYGLSQSLRLLREEGYENYVARHERHASPADCMWVLHECGSGCACFAQQQLQASCWPSRACSAR